MSKISLSLSRARVQKKKEAVRTFFILDLRFHVVDRVRRLDFESDGFPRQSFTAINKERYEKVDDDTTRQKTLT